MQSHNNEFRIGILSYNHPELTKRTIHSCLKLVESSQITLLHNGSETKWVASLKESFPDIEHIALTNNAGFTGGVNSLLQHVLSLSEWCLFLTNDVQLLSLKVPAQPGLVAPLVYRRKIEFIDSIGGRFYPQRGHLEHCRTESDFLNLPTDSIPYVPGTGFWIHQNIFRSVGLFDTFLGTYWEDVDYSQRVRINGFRLGVETETKMIHSVGKTCHKNRIYTSYLYPRNKYYVSLRYNQKPLSRAFFRSRYWSHLVFDLVKALFKRDIEGFQFKYKILKELVL
jgi:GT2 family glycosyltransferase